MEELLDFESLGVVDEGTVNATLVRTLEVDVFVTAFLHIWLCHKVVEGFVVFHFANTDNAGSIWQLVCAEVAKSTSHIGKFVRVLVLVPMV